MDVLTFNSTYTMTPVIPRVTVHKIREVKQHRLERQYRDSQYPSKGTPFYLYGTPEEQHVDHILVQSPNTQISAQKVKLDLRELLTGLQTDLEKGCILMINDFKETLLQPCPLNIDMTALNGGFFFQLGRTFNVSVYKDKKATGVNGPGLVDVTVADLLATGKMTLVNGTTTIFVDSEAPNKDPFFEKKRQLAPWKDGLKSVNDRMRPL